MSYVIDADIERRLGSAVYVQLTDDAGNGFADAAKVAEARQGSEAEVNSYLGRRYAVPVDVSVCEDLAALLKSVTLDLCEYRLHARRPPVPDDVAHKRAMAVEWLERVAAGEVVLPSDVELAGNAATGISGEVVGQSRVMSRESLEQL